MEKPQTNNLKQSEYSLQIQAMLLNQVTDSQVSDLILFFNSFLAKFCFGPELACIIITTTNIYSAS